MLRARDIKQEHTIKIHEHNLADVVFFEKGVL
jgi:hypothetical protein